MSGSHSVLFAAAHKTSPSLILYGTFITFPIQKWAKVRNYSSPSLSHPLFLAPLIDVITTLNVIHNSDSTQARVNDNTEKCFPMHIPSDVFLKEYLFADRVSPVAQYYI